ncbi:hypothetical protein [Nocardia sp. NPDC005366]|uniref:hypothetical protein n=1 Tax=Nocardia sp. NPDC005366 TaxID=3156878 RepID=UPI0033B5A9EB
MYHYLVVPPANNPAARLAVIMRRLHAEEPTQTAKEALTHVLDCASDAELGPALGALHALPAQVVEAVNLHADPEHDDLNLFLKWQSGIAAALNQTWALTSAVQKVQAKYTSEDLSHLDYCSGLLSRARIERQIDARTLDELRNLIQSLEKDLMDIEDIPADLKSFIIDQLDIIRTAIREYRIGGPLAFEHAFDRVVGACLRRSELVNDANEASQSSLGKFREILGAVESLAKTTTVSAGAAMAVIGAILAGHHAVENWQSPPALEHSIKKADSKPPQSGDGSPGAGITQEAGR